MKSAEERCCAISLYASEEVTRKPKKSDLEDLQKALSPLESALSEQHKIILLNSY
jgi:hypothetical protein